MIKYEKVCQNKKILTSVFEILPMNFRFVSPCCFFNIKKHCPKAMFFINCGSKKSCCLGMGGAA